MRIVPVIDLKEGVVVRGVGGRREAYQPIVSCLTKSCQPVEVARAFRDQLGFREIYLADLDAIAGGSPAFGVYAEIQALGCQLWVDAGIRDPGAAAVLVQNGIEHLVVGLETIGGPGFLQHIVEKWNTNRVLFSLDLKDGLPMGKLSAWRRADAWSIAVQAIDMGVRRVIILDLARVGTAKGPGTEEFCRRLSSHFPEVEIIAGGGVDSEEDLQRLHQNGVSAVLMASALHEGKLPLWR